MSKPNYEAAAATIALLAERFPACFFVDEAARRPLKVGTDHDLRAALSGEVIGRNKLRAALKQYVNSTGYLRASVIGAPRLGLDGAPAGEVSASEAGFAAERLAARRQRPARRPARTASPTTRGAPGVSEPAPGASTHGKASPGQDGVQEATRLRPRWGLGAPVSAPPAAAVRSGPVVEYRRKRRR